MTKKMTMLNKLKLKYDSLTIDKIEHSADDSRELSLKNEKARILVLYYLQCTNRFRENEQYKDSSFDVYLRYRHGIRPNTYQERKLAFLGHEKESMIYGPGLVSKVRRDCGPMMVKEVFSKIKPDYTREKIDNVVKAYTKPKPQKAEVPKITQSDIDKLRKELLAKEKELVEAKEQIAKLKATVEKYKKKYLDLVEVTAPFIKQTQAAGAVIGQLLS